MFIEKLLCSRMHEHPARQPRAAAIRGLARPAVQPLNDLFRATIDA